MDADSRLVWTAVVDGSVGGLRLVLVSGSFGALTFAVLFMYGAFDAISVVVLLSIQFCNVDVCPLLPARFENDFMGFGCGAISYSHNC
jgi:hypothetical protein